MRKEEATRLLAPLPTLQNLLTRLARATGLRQRMVQIFGQRQSRYPVA